MVEGTPQSCGKQGCERGAVSFVLVRWKEYGACAEHAADMYRALGV